MLLIFIVEVLRGTRSVRVHQPNVVDQPYLREGPKNPVDTHHVHPEVLRQNLSVNIRR